MNISHIIEAYHGSLRRLLLLDYDGVMTPIVARPELAKPSTDVRNLLYMLGSDTHTTCVIVSGRDHETLERWLGDLPIALVAEHGLWQKEEGIWHLTSNVAVDWKSQIRATMERSVRTLEGSFIEEKYASVGFHYRGADESLADNVVQRLVYSLGVDVEAYNLRILHGKKVVEVIAAGVEKGEAIRPWLKKENWDFILGAGDDVTDESLFATLPAEAYSIKVGAGTTCATTRAPTQRAFIRLLSQFCEK